ncbi:hypothetical protein ACIRP5_10075 [Streptomyces sp. NPDC101221]|uniref:hypothetical protein n=1 Tax=Streptomyces sp. NPDC101221 TaxID=3366132 RepID=UPI0038019276
MYEISLTRAGFLSAAAAESRKLAGHMRLLRTAQAKGNRGGVVLAARKVQETADRIDNLLTAADQFDADA